jgi:hypothetical protein
MNRNPWHLSRAIASWFAVVRVGLVLSAVMIPLMAQALAPCPVTGFGPTTQDPLIIMGSWNIANGCLLDFGARHVILGPTAVLTVAEATIHAGQFTMSSGSLIESPASGTGLLSITTLPSGANSGDIVIGGHIDLSSNVAGGIVTLTSGAGLFVNANAWVHAHGTQPGAAGGTITLVSQGAMSIGDQSTLVALDASGDGAARGIISLQSGAAMSLYSSVKVEGDDPNGGFTATSAGNYHHLGGDVRAGGGALPVQFPGGRITVTSGGQVTILGIYDACSSISIFTLSERGHISLSAVGDIHVPGVLAATGALPALDDGVFLSSQAGSIAVSGVVDASGLGGDGGPVVFDAARDIDLSGTVTMTGSADRAVGGSLQLHAGQTVTVSGSADGSAFVVGAMASLMGCRVILTASSLLRWDGLDAAGDIAVTAQDVLEAHGTMSAVTGGASVGAITLKTRLGARYSPLTSGGTFNPAPLVLHDAALPPCLALTTTSLTGPTPLVPGNTFVVNLTSVASKPVLVLAGLSLQHLSLGNLGWTQVDVFSAARLADPGVLGAPIPGSATDANGHWGISIPTPASASFLIGLTIYIEAFVIDSGALNGVFHQPPYLAILFV